MARASDRDPALDAPAPAPAPSPAPKPDPLAEGRQSSYVRVRHPQTGDHYTTTRVLARKAGATLLPDHDAVDKHGRPLPRKPHTSKES